MVEYRTAVCPHDCPDSCAVRVGVEGGEVVSIEGDAEHPLTRGFLCGKVNRYKERIYAPQRVLTPLRRIAAKGEGRFEPIGWETALAEIAAGFARVIETHGPEAILPYSYGGTIGRVQNAAGHRFFHGLGASRLARTICTGSAVEGQRMTTGVTVGSDLHRISHAKLVLLWGINAVASHIHLMPLVKEARRNGARIVCIDAYRNATARQADDFYRVRPGTDTALALGMIRLILAEGLEDGEFVERYTMGIEALREAAAPYTPERVEQITGLPAADVAALARAYGSERASFIRLGGGVSRHSNGGMNVRTISCLPAVTGAYANPAGGFLCFSLGSYWLNKGYLDAPHPDDPPARTINMVRLGEALTGLDDPPVKAMYVYNSNPAVIAPDQTRVHRGLAREDLFLVVHEQMHTDTVAYADIVLPATTFMEHDDLLASYGGQYLQRSRAAIPPRGEARSNWDTFTALALAMGLQGERFGEPFERLVAGLLDADNEVMAAVDREALMAGKPIKMALPETPWETGLRTPSGRFEFFSEKMARRGQPPEPRFLPSDEGHQDNDLRRRYPLQLVTPPSQHMLNSSFGETESARRLERTPLLKMHPRDAAARHLADGMACRAFNDRGECFLTVELTDDVLPGVTVAEGLWWRAGHGRGLGINALTSAELTDLGDCARFHDGLIDVEPVTH